MSWKNLATVVVCALMASTAWAGPTLDLRNTGLNSSGLFVWQLRVTPDASLFTNRPELGGVGGSLAIELGLQSSLGNILSITPNPGTIPNATTGTAAAPVEFENPGNQIFTWEKLTDVQNPAPPDVPNMKPVGILLGSNAAHTQTNTVTNPNQAFLSVGTTFFKLTDTVPTNGHLIATITTTGPSTTTSLTSMLSVMGSYGGNGAIAQSTGADTAVLFDDYTGAASRTMKAADANGDGSVNGLDLTIMSNNFGGSGKNWTQADFNGDGNVNGLDLTIMSNNFGQSGGSNIPLTVIGSGSGAGGSTAIPEPASIVLMGIALLAGLGLVRRK